MDDLGNSSHAKRRELFFPRGLSVLTRMHLWMRGYLDAGRGSVHLSQGQVTSPYCRKLAQQADLRINVEWQDCNGEMFRLRPLLEKAIQDRDEVAHSLEALSEKKASKMQDASIRSEGDAAMSEHMAMKRKRRRQALVEAEFASREAHLRSILSREQAAVSSILAQYQDAEDIATTHERIVRMEYLAKLSCYSRGASRKMAIELAHVNDAALTTVPKKENEALFGACARCISGIERDGT